MKNLMLATLMMLRFQFANAQEHVLFSQPAFGGTGCKGDETAPVLDLKKRTLTLSTLSLVGDATNQALILREACNIRLGARVEKAINLAFVFLTYRVLSTSH